MWRRRTVVCSGAQHPMLEETLPLVTCWWLLLNLPRYHPSPSMVTWRRETGPRCPAPSPPGTCPSTSSGGRTGDCSTLVQMFRCRTMSSAATSCSSGSSLTCLVSCLNDHVSVCLLDTAGATLVLPPMLLMLPTSLHNSSSEVITRNYFSVSFSKLFQFLLGGSWNLTMLLYLDTPWLWLTALPGVTPDQPYHGGSLQVKNYFWALLEKIILDTLATQSHNPESLGNFSPRITTQFSVARI